MTSFKQLTDFLRREGIEKIPHTKKSYLAHLIGVYRDLESWGASEELCRAGMFHSIYGTQQFQGFKLPLERRGELREMIGERAERLAYCNCAMDRSSFDQAVYHGTYRFTDRITKETIELSPEDFDDLVRIHLCDMLEQVQRAEVWDVRRAAFRHMATRLGGVALKAYDCVFATEPASVSNQG